jgi:hypothetical protein
MQKNIVNFNSNIGSNTKLFEDASKKLQKIEKDRHQAEKYFKERENAENKMKLLESNLKKKVKLDKRAALGLEEKTVEKMQTLLKSLTNVDVGMINKIEISEKNSQHVQTEQEDTQVMKEKLITLEKENEKSMTKKKEYKKQIELFKSEIETLKSFNQKLSKENKLLQHNLEESGNSKHDLEIKNKDLILQIENLNEIVRKSQQTLKDYEELKKIMEEKLRIETQSLEIEEQRRDSAVKNHKGSLKLLIYFDLIDQVTKFLPAADVMNLKKADKMIYDGIDNNLRCMNSFYKNLIISYKKKLQEISSLDIKKEYLVSDIEIERLIKE